MIVVFKLSFREQLSNKLQGLFEFRVQATYLEHTLPLKCIFVVEFRPVAYPKANVRYVKSNQLTQLIIAGSLSPKLGKESRK